MTKFFFAHEYSLTSCVGSSLCTMLIVVEQAYIAAAIAGLVTVAIGVWGEMRLEGRA